ncbi:hypothetical protein IAR50_004600 [Cryptococcus sp. DSM 104548]
MVPPAAPIHSSLPPIAAKALAPFHPEDGPPGTAPLPSFPPPEPPTPAPRQDISTPSNNNTSTNTLYGSPIVPSSRSPSSRPLSPDLPNRDALYLFVNFSSYMRSPHEGSKGVAPEDFRDTIRLLDHARFLTSQASSNVHILHLKYRYQGQHNAFRSPYSSGDHQLPLNYRDPNGRLRNPVPQPFSVLHDPVIKVDYMENGIFDPLPAQAVFSHIAKACQPPPRIIVISYVYSKVTENHLSSLSTWAFSSTPPAYIFSPLETRLREQRPLHLALNHAIPMSMYAWPLEMTQSSTGLSIHRMSPLSGVTLSPSDGTLGGAMSKSGGKADWRYRSKMTDNSPVLLTRRFSDQGAAFRGAGRSLADKHSEGRGDKRKQPSLDPVATLTLITSSPENPTSLSRPTSPSLLDCPAQHGFKTNQPTIPPIDRIPLWHLAPGVGILHGSVSASIGIRLGDFSAVNLVGDSGRIEKGEADKRIMEREMDDLGVKTEVMGNDELRATDGIGVDVSGFVQGNLEASGLLERPTSRPSSTAPISLAGGRTSLNSDGNKPSGNDTTPLVLSIPPGRKQKSLPRRWQSHSAGSQSWPAPVTRLPGWRKGRKEMMEDILDEMGVLIFEEDPTFPDLEGPKVTGSGLQIQENGGDLLSLL